jgi:hypothetical protein
MWRPGRCESTNVFVCSVSTDSFFSYNEIFTVGYPGWEQGDQMSL